MERAARAAGVGVLRLETNRKLAPARRLYEAAGYRPRPAFGRYVSDAVKHYYGKTF